MANKSLVMIKIADSVLLKFATFESSISLEYAGTQTIREKIVSLSPVKTVC